MKPPSTITRTWERMWLLLTYLGAALIIGTVAAAVVPAVSPSSLRHMDALRFATLFDNGLREGTSAPRIRVLVYTKYRCSQCDSLDAAIRQLLHRYPEYLAISWKLILQPNSPPDVDLVTAAHCAFGDHAFAEYNRTAFRLSSRPSAATWSDVVDSARIAPASSVRSCVEGGLSRARVAADFKEATQLGIHDYPAVFVNSARLQSDVNLRALDSAIVSFLRR